MKSIQSNIKKAKKYLDNNHCVVVPTETVYGLAGNAYSDLSVKKIFRLKKRPMNNPLIVHYSDINKLKDDCHISDNFIKLYNKLSPGPITFILKLKKDSKISKFVTNKQKSLAVRFPKHPLFRKLLKSLDYPLAAPSANMSTRLSSVKAADVIEEFGSKIKYVLDGGKCKIGLESTIVSLLDKPTILRYGGLDILKIKKVLNKKVLVKTTSKKKIAPGQFPLHYSPGIPLRINAKKPIILLGNQVTQNKEALPQFIKSLNKLSIPTYTSGMSRGCFNEDDTFFMRHNRKHALKNADVVLTIGLPLDFRLGYGSSINKNAKIIAINKSKTDMKKNRKPFIGIHGDPTRAMCEIAKVINPMFFPSTLLNKIVISIKYKGASGYKRYENNLYQ